MSEHLIKAHHEPRKPADIVSTSGTSREQPTPDKALYRNVKPTAAPMSDGASGSLLAEVLIFETMLSQQVSTQQKTKVKQYIWAQCAAQTEHFTSNIQALLLPEVQMQPWSAVGLCSWQFARRTPYTFVLKPVGEAWAACGGKANWGS